MKAWDICKKENVGKVYKDNNGEEFEVKDYVGGYAGGYDLSDKNGGVLSIHTTISYIAKMDFTEVIKEVDWSKVTVDTKILIKDEEDDDWEGRYFATYIDGKVYAWSDGGTSFTATTVTSWKCAKLYEGEE